jgi:hypothetical protein
MKIIYQPENDNKPIKQIETALNVSEWPFGKNLQQHFECEQPTEEEVTVFENHR